MRQFTHNVLPKPRADGWMSKATAQFQHSGGNAVDGIFVAEREHTTCALAVWLKQRARYHCLPASDRDDCVQEAFLALLKTHPEWRLDDHKTKAWLAGVVRNQALDIRRFKHRRSLTLLGDLAFVLSADPSQAIKEDDPRNPGERVRFKLQQALNALPEDNREILTQRVLLNLPYREIGKPLGLTANQVKSRYNRTVATLRKRLGSQSHALDKHDCVDVHVGGGGRLRIVRILHGRLGSNRRSIEALGIPVDPERVA